MFYDILIFLIDSNPVTLPSVNIFRIWQQFYVKNFSTHMFYAHTMSEEVDSEGTSPNCHTLLNFWVYIFYNIYDIVLEW